MDYKFTLRTIFEPDPDWRTCSLRDKGMLNKCQALIRAWHL
jgi:hypothetical protein